MADRARAMGLVDDAWNGRPAFLLGGGPSLLQIGELKKLEDRGYIVALNRALELPLNVDLWTWIDSNFYTRSMRGD